MTGRMTNKTAAGDRETKRAPHDNELGGCLMAEATFYDSRTSAARKADDFCTLDDSSFQHGVMTSVGLLCSGGRGWGWVSCQSAGAGVAAGGHH